VASQCFVIISLVGEKGEVPPLPLHLPLLIGRKKRLLYGSQALYDQEEGPEEFVASVGIPHILLPQPLPFPLLVSFTYSSFCSCSHPIAGYIGHQKSLEAAKLFSST